ncbi:hypothetical protein [Methanocella sp. MCL-LM]|uniref:hypothetical protein n=1 Tax=Methanocella sp. MCL-LM TaxID=3412035 RepID=UPI003C725E9F
MSMLQALYCSVKADYLERVRGYGFMFVLLVTLFAAYAFVPDASAGYITLKMISTSLTGDVTFYRGVYNSAWVGAMVALPTVMFLGLAGFYLVKNAITRDRMTGVGQIIATTPLSKPLYLLSKAVSNFAILSTIVVVIILGALAMQLFRGDGSPVDLWALAAPFLLIVLPFMAVVAAVAVFFESVAVLRGSIGNVVYFFLYLIFMTVMLEQTMSAAPGTGLSFLFDAFGAGLVIPDILATVKTLYPLQGEWTWALGFVSLSKPAATFVWNGIAWTPVMLAGRAFWVILAVGLALAGSVFFDRFDSAAAARKNGAKNSEAQPAAGSTGRLSTPTDVRLSSLAAGTRRFSYPGVLMAELRLLLRGQKWWWYAGAGLIILAGLVSPAETARGWVLLAAIVWPLFIWSSLGCREKTWNTGQLVFSSPKPLLVQLSAAWLCGFTVTITLCSGVLFSLVAASDFGGVLAVTAGAILIPSMALAMGIWSGTSKLFEALYLTLWYVGPVNHYPALDYAGITAVSGVTVIPVTWIGLALVFVALAVIGRYRQI